MKCAVVILFLAGALWLPAQCRTVTVGRLLLSAFSDPVVAAGEDRVRTITRSYGGIPFVDNIQLRTRNTAFDIGQLQYTLRIAPRGFGETAGGTAYDLAVLHNAQMRIRMLANRTLKARYALAIDILQDQETLRGLDTLIMLYEDRVRVMESGTYRTDFDLNSLIETENEGAKLRIQRIEMRKNIRVNTAQAAMLIGDSTDGVDTTGVVSVDSIIEWARLADFRIDSANIHLMDLRAQYDMAQARYRLEKAENRRYVDYLEFSYDNDAMHDELLRRRDGKTYNLNQAYRIEAGVSIPDLTMARRDLLKRELTYLSEKEQYEVLRRELSESMAKDIADIGALIEEYQFMKSRETEVDAQSSLKKYLGMSGIDPLVLLQTKESIEKNRIAMTRIRFDILRNYIQVMDAAGRLTGTPPRNLLSRGSAEVLK